MKPQMAIDQCFLYRCRSKKKLADHLQIDKSMLKSISSWAKYDIRQEAKSSGGVRTIYAPHKQLKIVQRRIKHLLERIEKPDWVFSGVKGKCHVDNALSHVGNRFYVLTDIAGFYEHCTRDAVYRFFRDVLETSPDVAALLADMTTCKGESGRQIIPAGSPCSQLLAYYSYASMFDEIAHCAELNACRLSLYVDDLTFSSKFAIENPKSLMKQVDRILKSYGHSMNWSKTRYFGKGEFKVVTGVALDGEGQAFVPNKLGMNIMDGFRSVLAGSNPNIAQTQGRIGAARQIVPGAFPEISRLLSSE